MNRRGFLTAAAGALAAGTLLACGIGGDDEDCDEDDRREGDTDCDDDGTRRRRAPRRR